MTARYRWEVAGRFLLAGAGGYVLTALLTTVLALALPRLPASVSSVSQAEAVLTASLLSFALYTLFVLWVFAVRSAWRVWGWSVAAAVLLYGMVLWCRSG
ncbi:MAG: iron transporter [Duganella sp.]